MKLEFRRDGYQIKRGIRLSGYQQKKEKEEKQLMICLSMMEMTL